MLSCHNVSLKFYLVDIAVVNGFLPFLKHRQEHLEEKGLQRSSTYSIFEFRKALIRQICGWEEYDDPPAYERSAPGHNLFQANHMPKPLEDGVRRDCFACYREGRGEKNVVTYCAAPQC